MNDKTPISPFNPHTLDALWQLQKIILDSPEIEDVVEKVVNSVLRELGYLQLGYRILVLTLVDHKTNTLRRIALSQTPEAEKALAASPVPFKQIAIPLDAEDNSLIRALKEKEIHVIHSWPDIFKPVLTDAEALHNQEAAGIKTSMLYPIVVKDEAIGVMIFSMVKDEDQVSDDERTLISRFTDIVGLALQNSLLYTSVKENAEQLEIVNNKLKDLDKLKDEFVSVASHELRTPMTAIKSYLWMALDGKGGDLNEKQRYYVQRGYNSVDRLIRLVNDMLNISRIESGRISVSMQSLDLIKLTQEVVEEVQPRANELGIKVIVEKVESLPNVLADSDKIKEVLFNLIGNSLKFTPRDGSITVSFVQQDGFVVTKIKDTGSGIEAEDINKLFQKFGLLPGSYITNQVATGTGLGLYICRAIINLHHGKTWAESEGRGKGATFYFSLKIFNEADAPIVSNEEKKEKMELIHTGI